MSFTLASTGSLAVQVLICDAVITDESNASISRIVSPGSGILIGDSGNGSRLSKSAIPLSCPLLNLI